MSNRILKDLDYDKLKVLLADLHSSKTVLAIHVQNETKPSSYDLFTACATMERALYFLDDNMQEAKDRSMKEQLDRLKVYLTTDGGLMEAKDDNK